MQPSPQYLITPLDHAPFVAAVNDYCRGDRTDNHPQSKGTN
jgi:hypothetical protein